jgi:hypothetical protein
MSMAVIRPYKDLDGCITGIKYRSNPGVVYEELDIIAADSIAHIVKVDDLRTFPTHEFQVRVDESRIRAIYGKDISKISFIVLMRDRALHRDLVLVSVPIIDLPESITLSREQLQRTSARDRLELVFTVLMQKVSKWAPGLPVQSSSRLTSISITLQNSADGAQFPFRRKTADDFQSLGLPKDTTIYLQIDAPIELLKSEGGALPLEDLLEVWLHEGLYDAVHNDKQHITATIRNSAITMTVVTQILASVESEISRGTVIETGSVINRLLQFIEKRTARPQGQLVARFQRDNRVNDIVPYIQSAFRITSSLSRLSEDSPP